MQNKNWILPEEMKKLEQSDTGGHKSVFASYKAMLDGNFEWVRNHAVMDEDEAAFYSQTVASIVGAGSSCWIGSVLDMGCGPGVITNALARQFKFADVKGVDISGAAIKYASGKYSLCKFDEATIDDNFKPQQKYDLVHAREFYPFTRTDDAEVHEQYLSILHRALNPGGYLVICHLPVVDWPHFKTITVPSRKLEFLPLRANSAVTGALKFITGKPRRMFYLTQNDIGFGMGEI